MRLPAGVCKISHIAVWIGIIFRVAAIGIGWIAVRVLRYHADVRTGSHRRIRQSSGRGGRGTQARRRFACARAGTDANAIPARLAFIDNRLRIACRHAERNGTSFA